MGEPEHGEEGEVGAGLGWLAGSWAGQLHPPGGPRAALTGMQDTPPPHMVHSFGSSSFLSFFQHCAVSPAASGRYIYNTVI